MEVGELADVTWGVGFEEVIKGERDEPVKLEKLKVEVKEEGFPWSGNIKKEVKEEGFPWRGNIKKEC